MSEFWTLVSCVNVLSYKWMYIGLNSVLWYPRTLTVQEETLKKGLLAYCWSQKRTIFIATSRKEFYRFFRSRLSSFGFSCSYIRRVVYKNRVMWMWQSKPLTLAQLGRSCNMKTADDSFRPKNFGVGGFFKFLETARFWLFVVYWWFCLF